MAGESVFEEILDLWEEQRQTGNAAGSEEFIRQHAARLSPDQIAELRQAIHDLEAMKSALATNSQAAMPDPGGDGECPFAGKTLTAQARFRVAGLHARGGLGEVYLADDEQLGRDVALKVIQPARARMPTSQARFLREVRLTSRLQHPGIVPVYGSGEDEGGVPFYIMRFVSGRTLQEVVHDYHGQSHSEITSSSGRLAFQQLLRRFIVVCDTIAYAHSRGVLHRDLKPSNILVGDFGETLVVDWGLARAEAGGEGPASDEPPVAAVTNEGAVLGTPGYMSPEQASGKSEGIGPATDIYSLGAVFYNILTGRRPFDGTDPVDILRRNRENYFPPPHVVRGSVPKALEAICLKAMALKPEHRYASVADLGRDVEHWLADEPVSAWQDPWTVRTRRWLSKHRTLTASTAAAVVVALASLTVATVLLNTAWREADNQKALAERRFHQARRAIDEFYTEVSENPRLLRNEPATQEIRRILLERAQKYYQEFLDDRAEDPRLLEETARAHFRVANIHFELHPGPEALVGFQKARDLFESLASVDHHPDLAKDLAAAHGNIALLEGAAGKLMQARASFARARAIDEQLVSQFPKSREYRAGLARLYRNMAVNEGKWSNLQAAKSLCVEARRHQEKLLAEEPSSLEYKRELAKTLNVFGKLESATGSLNRAKECHLGALKLLELVPPTDPSTYGLTDMFAQTWEESGELASAQGNDQEAMAAFSKVLAIREKQAKENPSVSYFNYSLAMTCRRMGELLYGRGKAHEALSYCEKARAVFERLSRENPTMQGYRGEGLALTYLTVGKMRIAGGELNEAVECFEKARECIEPLVDEQPEFLDYGKRLVVVYLELGTAQVSLGRSNEGRSNLQKALAYQEKLSKHFPDLPAHVEQLARVYRYLGGYYQVTGKPDEGVPYYQKALSEYSRLPPEWLARPAVLREVAWTHTNIGAIRQNRRDRNGALAALEQARKIRMQVCQTLPESRRDAVELASVYERLGLLHQEAGQLSEARTCFKRALDLDSELVSSKETLLQAELHAGAMQFHLARVARQEGKLDKALQLFGQAIKILEPLRRSDPIKKQAVETLLGAHAQRLQTLVELRRYVEVTDGSEGLLAQWPDDPRLLFEVACALALLSDYAIKDAGLKPLERDNRVESLRKRAVQVLAQAKDKGLFRNSEEADRLRQVPSLQSLRARSDFRKLLESIEDVGSPKMDETP